VAVSRAFGIANIDAAAKTGDQVLAVATVVVIGGFAGATLFSALVRSDEPALIVGGILGAIVGGVVLIAERQLMRLPPGSFVPGAWVVVTFVAWGVALGWVRDRTKLSTTEDAEDAAGRRKVLKTLAAASVVVSAASTAAGALASRMDRRFVGRRWSDDNPLPNAGASVKPPPGTRPEFTPLEEFYRIDTDTRAPVIDADRWRLSIGGLVDRQQALTLGDLRELEPTHLLATLCCISNPPGGDLISTTRWSGVSLRRLLPRLGLQPSATHLKAISADGFFESISLDTIRADERVMLAYAWDGVPLPIEHGYPLRLYIPDLYGMKQPKWIVGLDATSHWEPGYWVARGWSKDGIVATMAAIDVVNATEAGGVAFAGARGISKVEVRVDEGEWQVAQLRGPLSDLSWVVWRAELTASSGQHVLMVRAIDSTGQPQPSAFHTRRFLL
ncbi:MAG TPA: molybdopterin-dependent oxidoreductase, partial [Vicinamibacterales bacterium]|nr:molybdopterin-dependent oxidoreductase [Vicinamibacterales bacterium]